MLIILALNQALSPFLRVLVNYGWRVGWQSFSRHTPLSICCFCSNHLLPSPLGNKSLEIGCSRATVGALNFKVKSLPWYLLSVFQAGLFAFHTTSSLLRSPSPLSRWVGRVAQHCLRVSPDPSVVVPLSSLQSHPVVVTNNSWPSRLSSMSFWIITIYIRCSLSLDNTRARSGGLLLCFWTIAVDERRSLGVGRPLPVLGGCAPSGGFETAGASLRNHSSAPHVRRGGSSPSLHLCLPHTRGLSGSGEILSVLRQGW